VVQEVEHLPTKCEALSSNPNTTKKKERKKEGRKKGRKEGRNEIRKERRKEGRKEGRKKLLEPENRAVTELGSVP
jgi:hypothetical protein